MGIMQWSTGEFTLSTCSCCALCTASECTLQITFPPGAGGGGSCNLWAAMFSLHKLSPSERKTLLTEFPTTYPVGALPSGCTYGLLTDLPGGATSVAAVVISNDGF